VGLRLVRSCPRQGGRLADERADPDGGPREKFRVKRPAQRPAASSRRPRRPAPAWLGRGRGTAATAVGDRRNSRRRQCTSKPNTRPAATRSEPVVRRAYTPLILCRRTSSVHGGPGSPPAPITRPQVHLTEVRSSTSAMTGQTEAVSMVVTAKCLRDAPTFLL